MRRLVQLLVPCLLLGGCFGPGEGLEVPSDEIYFPVGLALDSSNEHLFVVSSDFDLQYNGGAIQSYRLGDLSDSVPNLAKSIPTLCSTDDDCKGQPCESGLCLVVKNGVTQCEGGDQTAAQKLLYPSRCRPIAPKGLQQSTVKVGAFATDVIVRPNPNPESPGDRLFVPVRGDTTLHWLDVNGGVLDCGQDHERHCDDAHRAGQKPSIENARNVSLNAEPFAIDANEDGSTVVVTNQTTGTASLFVNDWYDSFGPKLRFALASDRIPARPVGIASLPALTPKKGESGMDKLPPPLSDTFLMTFRNSAQVRLIRFAPNAEQEPEREYLVDGGGVAIDANSVGSDSRGIAIDPSARKRAVTNCAEDTDCIGQAELTPIDVYVANRTPASLLIGRTQPPLEYPTFFQSLPLTVGPSRVVVGKVKTPSGDEETRVFVVCFDSRRIFVYDPKRKRFESEILTGRGPHAVAVDTQRSLLYVGHFTDSFVGVFSLDLSHPDTYGTMLGILGNPKPPRSSK